jgi:hypothetical protein
MLGERLDRPERALEHLAEHVLAFRFLHRQLAGHHLVEDTAEEVNVRPGVAFGALARALERRVIDRALALDAGLGFIALHGRQSEVDQLGDAGIRDQNIGSLDIAVSHTTCERVLEPARHPKHERHGLFGRDPGAQLHEIAQVHSLDVFHDHEVPILLLSHVDHLNDIGVTQPHAGLGLLVKPVDSVGKGGKPLAQDLDRQGRLRRHVLAAVDSGESSLRQVEEYLGVAEEKSARVTLLEPLDLPARDRSFTQQQSQHRVRLGVLGIRRGLSHLLGRDQPEHPHLIEHHLGVDFGHGQSILALAGRETRG